MTLLKLINLSRYANFSKQDVNRQNHCTSSLWVESVVNLFPHLPFHASNFVDVTNKSSVKPYLILINSSLLVLAVLTVSSNNINSLFRLGCFDNMMVWIYVSVITLLFICEVADLSNSPVAKLWNKINKTARRKIQNRYCVNN